MSKSKYTDEQFKEAIKSSISIRECLIKLGLNHTGGNYKTFYKKVNELNIDIKHFLGKSHMIGKENKFVAKKPLSEILKINVSYQSHILKLRLIKAGIKERKCEMCRNIEWMGKEIPLELDHINGVHNDNRIENLRILCPNCHAQTLTYCGKNIKIKSTINQEQKRKINRAKKKENLIVKNVILNAQNQKLVYVKNVDMNL